MRLREKHTTKMKISRKKQKQTIEKIKENKKPNDKHKDEKVMMIAQEIKFGRMLSGNDAKTRNRILKTLSNWLTNCLRKGYDFREDDFIRVWKGLFYAVWMSDKPLVQEELCEKIAALLDLFPPEQLKYALMMMKAGFRVLAIEWFGIDQHRMDKFLMLVRRYLRGCFRCLKRCEWSVPSCKAFADMLTSGDGIFAPSCPHYARNATSMVLHVIDCYLEELSKVSRGGLSPRSACEVLSPLCVVLCGECGARGGGARAALTALLRQSPAGLDYHQREQLWKSMGCPAGGPDALVPVDDGDSGDDSGDNGDNGDNGDDSEHVDDDAGPLDPRAGRVDVTLTPVPVPAALLARRLRTLVGGADITAAARRRATLCMQRFERLAQGEYPLRVREKDYSLGRDGKLPRPTVAARALQGLEKKLIADSDELALRGLGRRHRKRLLAAARAGCPLLADQSPPASSDPPAPAPGPGPQTPAAAAHSGKWQIENTEPKTQTDKKQGKKRKQEQKKKHEPLQIAKKRRTEEKTDEKKKEVVLKKKKDKTLKKKKNEVKVKMPVMKTEKKQDKPATKENKIIEKRGQKKEKETKMASVVASKLKKKQIGVIPPKKKERVSQVNNFSTPKKVKFVLKNNSMQKPVDYYKSVRQSPNIPFDSSKQPSKTNLKPSTPSPINPFVKIKFRRK